MTKPRKETIAWHWVVVVGCFIALGITAHCSNQANAIQCTDPPKTSISVPEKPKKPMRLGFMGQALIKHAEGLMLCTYDDAAGLPSIGYGHLIQPTDNFPDCISPAEAERVFQKDVAWAERCVNNNVKREMTEYQHAALVSLTFNIGCKAFQESTALKRFNEGDIHGAAVALQWWNQAGGRVLAGLKIRRCAEAYLLSGEVCG